MTVGKGSCDWTYYDSEVTGNSGGGKRKQVDEVQDRICIEHVQFEARNG